MFEGEDKIICSSLFSWINDGSHFVNDDLYICAGDVTVQKYLEMFKGIFQESRHIEHYNMMMGDHTFPLADSETNDMQPSS
jgi:wobble nucleotide-excising tRNase